MLIGIFYSQIVESSSLVSVLFREVFSHPYISFFHLLVNGFSVTCIYIIGERAKRARHSQVSQVCSIENRIYIIIMVRAIFVLITRKEGGA